MLVLTAAPAATPVGSQMVIGLIIGIALLIFMVLKTKIHAFLALIIAATVTGLIGGMVPTAVVASITKGFGNTLGSIGIIIGFGVMMGAIFEASGAAERMALTFIEKLGHGREELALAITGFLVSIPIFCDSGFVILSHWPRPSPEDQSVVTLGVACGGLVITHSLVPTRTRRRCRHLRGQCGRRHPLGHCPGHSHDQRSHHLCQIHR